MNNKGKKYAILSFFAYCKIKTLSFFVSLCLQILNLEIFEF
jgi:hypothetical protein